VNRDGRRKKDGERGVESIEKEGWEIEVVYEEPVQYLDDDRRQYLWWL
jgi:hypothetical protein